MASTTDKALAPHGEETTPEQVEAFLRAHPEFLAERPGLVGRLTAPQRELGDNVADWQAFMIERLRSDMAEARRAQEALVDRERRERSLRDRVHAGALVLIASVDLDHLVEVVTSDLGILLGVDVVTLGVETTCRNGTARVTSGVRCLTKGTVAAIMGQDRDVVLRSPARADERLFTSSARLVESEALARFGGDDVLPQSVLALGSRHRDRFQAGDPVELYRFLAGVVDRCLRKKLGLPH